MGKDHFTGGEPSRRVNMLRHELSPYLLQHADNPVHWLPWGETAFGIARREDKPVFLSIGYSTCHWCHVMAHESFEDEEVAGLLNEAFVPVKVDREERPDIDRVYMTVCRLMTGGGGWPLTVIMTPVGKPFFAGTYFPRTSRLGRIGLLELLPRVAALWRNRRGDVDRSAEEATAALGMYKEESPGEFPKIEILDRAFRQFSRDHDEVFGGFGQAPKFPTPHNLQFLLRYWKRSGNPEALRMLERTLDGMRLGGIFDHLGYGFHRYSTDRNWLVPHFEKMLYDQATVSAALVEAWQAGGREEYAETARQVFRYVLRDLLSPEGAFYSAEDADSEGEEGKYYLWTEKEIREALDPEEAETALRAWNVLADGNYADEASGKRTGRNIFYLGREMEIAAAETGLRPREFSERLESARCKLFERRCERVRPLLDTKILTDWNGLMIWALSLGAKAFDDPALAVAASRAADFVLEKLRDRKGRLLHCWRDGKTAGAGNAEDYAFMVQGLLELYEASGFNRYFEAALELNRDMLELFWDREGPGGFFFTAADSEQVLVRQKEIYDGAAPSANSVAALNLLRLARMTGESVLEDKADRLFRAFSGTLERSPSAFSRLLCSLDFAYGPSLEVVLVSGGDNDRYERMKRTLWTGFSPNKVVLHRGVREESDAAGLVPVIGGMLPLDGRATAYVCRDFACELPATTPEKMLELLETVVRS